MTLNLSDREKIITIAALEFFRRAKQGSITPGPNQLPFKNATSEYDLLNAHHTLMHILTLLARLTGKPVTHFANPNPSQQPTPAVHLPEPPQTAI